MGAEGGNLTFAESQHSALWNEGLVTRRENGSAHFTPIAAGLGDWGLSYALTSFNDTKHNRRVQNAWAPEDIVGDGGIFSATQQGFQGSHTLMRELSVHEVDNVVDKDGSLAESKNAVLTKNADGTYLAQTLGVRPLPDVVEGLREGSTSCSYGGCKTYKETNMLKKQGSSSLEFESDHQLNDRRCWVDCGCCARHVGVHANHLRASNFTLLVVREHSTKLSDQFNLATVTGYFQPYDIQSADGSTARESITMDVFL